MCCVLIQFRRVLPDRLPKLKRMEQALPAHIAGMKDCSGISEKALADLPGLPSVRRHIHGHVNHYRSADDVVPGDAAPDSAVVGIGPVVAHCKITIVRYVIRKFDVGVTGRRASGRRGLSEYEGVRLIEFLAGDVNGAVAQVDGVTG